MQSADRAVARRYAQALFQAAGKDAGKTAGELSAALKTLEPRMDAFRNPMIAAARQKTLLKNQVGVSVSAKTLRLLELLIDKKRFALLPYVVAEFGRLADDSAGVVRAQVRAAAELTAPQADALRRKLEAFTGKKVVLDTRASPELLGGVVVRLGDWVLDGSLQGKLRRLAGQLAGA